MTFRPSRAAVAALALSAVAASTYAALGVAPPDPRRGPLAQQQQVPQIRYYTPRYVYVPGYYGMTYYYYVVPAPAVAQAPVPAQPQYYAAPRQASGEHYVGPMHPRDWSSGRYSPLAKPWLRPMD